VTVDGFEYIFEGFALYLRLRGYPVGFHFLRNPGFVLVTALDAALGTGGYLVLFVLAASIFAQHYLMVRIGDRLGVSRRITAAFVLGSLLFPFSILRFFILSELPAIALMLAGFYGLLRAQEPGRPKLWLAAGAVCASLAGLTQTYGLIPYLMGAGVWGLVALLRQRRIRWDLFVAAAAAVGLVVGVQTLWSWWIPHVYRINYFVFFGLDFQMWPFYANVWAYACLALLPFAAVTAWRVGWRKLLTATPALSLWAIVLAFVALTFFFHGEDIRFTYMYQQVVFLALMALTPLALSPGGDGPAGAWRVRIERLAWATSILILFQSLVLVPEHYWHPRPAHLRFTSTQDWLAGPLTDIGISQEFAASRPWLAEVLGAQPIDRYNLRDYCPSLDWVCPEAPEPIGIDPYSDWLQGVYRKYQAVAAAQGLIAPGRPVPWRRPSVMLVQSLAQVLERQRPDPEGVGAVESMQRNGPSTEIRGWVNAPAGDRGVRLVRLFVDGSPVAVGVPNVNSFALNREANQAGHPRRGFSIDLPASTLPIASGASVRVFAELMDGTTAELNWTRP
jgi:hypothetical protein